MAGINRSSAIIVRRVGALTTATTMVMRTSLLNTVMLFALAGAAWADGVAAQTSIYVYRDQGGVLNFTNIPRHDRGQTHVEVSKYRSSSAPRNTRVNYRPASALPQ